jgi:hypothetical protein
MTTQEQTTPATTIKEIKRQPAMPKRVLATLTHRSGFEIMCRVWTDLNCDTRDLDALTKELGELRHHMMEAAALEGFVYDECECKLEAFDF